MLLFTQDELAVILLEVHGRYDSKQDEAAAIIKKLEKLIENRGEKPVPQYDLSDLFS